MSFFFHLFREEDRSGTDLAIPGMESSRTVKNPDPTPIPKAHMSKAELKRLQWERERGR